MTVAELKLYIADQLAIPVTEASKVVDALNAIVDFAGSITTDVIPTWSGSLTFQTDGTDEGKYCKYADTDGNIRIFETKIDNNINHAPPTNPTISENTQWKEISASSGSSITEWAAGVFGTGLVINYYDHPEDGKGLYLLTDPARPFTSLNIETEIVAGKWERLTRPHPKFISTDVAAAPIILDMRLLKERMFKGSANIAANKTWQINNAGNAVQFRLRFQTDANIDHTFPATFKMIDAAWTSGSHTWHSYDAGEYEAFATYDGTSWHLKIDGPFQ